MPFTKLIIFLVSPLGTGLLLGLLALVLAWRGRGRLATGIGGVALLWMYAWSTPVLSLWLIGKLEQDFPAVPPESVLAAEAIVVLGGAITAPRSPGLLPNLQSPADRVWHAARLYKAGRAPIVLTSGGTDTRFSPVAEAEITALLLRDLGVPAEAVLAETKSANTAENAAFSARILRTRKLRRIILVTSAMHMPRALALFAAEGMQVTPAATDHEFTEVPWPEALLPDAGALGNSARAIKEVIARFALRIPAMQPRLDGTGASLPTMRADPTGFGQGQS